MKCGTRDVLCIVVVKYGVVIFINVDNFGDSNNKYCFSAGHCLLHRPATIYTKSCIYISYTGAILQQPSKPLSSPPHSRSSLWYKTSVP